MKVAQFVINAIHDTRQGIDTIGMPWERKTHYAKIDPNTDVVAVPIDAEREGGVVDTTGRSYHIAD
ncbi:hypothetical protein [Rhizobium sp. Rhizsp82]|uniref:hypothetical protein n=1 Tax=Rhizobium sp. Rhizsp82 TaxID=3243057 RepID=UPI0039B381FB